MQWNFAFHWKVCLEKMEFDLLFVEFNKEYPLQMESTDQNTASLQDVMNELDISTLGLIVAQHIFGDQLDDTSETLLLTAELDETEPIQGEFGAKLTHLFHENGIVPPETFIFQVFARKAGFVPKEAIGNYAMVVGIKDYQVITYDRKDYVIEKDSLSPLFQVSEGSIPRVIPNRTQIKLGKGKATIKPRRYMSMVVWAFWEEHPEMKPEPSNVQDDEIAKALQSVAVYPNLFRSEEEATRQLQNRTVRTTDHELPEEESQVLIF